VHVRKTEGADIRAGISMDQIAARELGRQTQLASLEMTLEYTEMLGACDAGYSCAYSNTISWRGPSTPLPMEVDPRALFERLFGDATAPITRLGSPAFAKTAASSTRSPMTSRGSGAVLGT